MVSQAKYRKRLTDEFPAECIFEFAREEYILVIVGYPHWRAYIYTPDKSFRTEVHLNIDVETNVIEFPPSSNHDKMLSRHDEKLVDRFFFLIPMEIKEQVKRFSCNHWELIKALNDFGSILTPLIQTNPALAFLIIFIDEFNLSYSFYNHLSHIKHIALSKQKEILSKAGFDGSDRLVKIFSKIDVKDLEVKHLLSLRNVLSSRPRIRNKVLKLFSHSKRITKNLLEIISADSAIIHILSPKALEQLSVSDVLINTINKLNSIIELSNKWGLSTGEIKDLSQIEFTLERINKRINDKIKKEAVFPPPPFFDNKYITAIRTPKAQRLWAVRQKNCIRQYIKNVESGKSYFYKINYKNEEATLEIKLRKDKAVMGDLFGTGNKKVSNELASVVADWIKRS